VEGIFQHDLTKNENPAENDHLDLKTVINEIFSTAIDSSASLENTSRKNVNS
jgi:hypothetical protein